MPTVKELRKARGWSQQELATRAGVGIQTVYRLESGGEVRGLVARAIREALGTNDVDIVVFNAVKRASATK